MGRRARRGLSPLIAAVVLISATIVGGMLVYQYFQNTMNKAKNLAESVSVTGDIMPLGDNTSLVTVTVVNNYDVPVKIVGAIAIYPDGSTSTLRPANGTQLPATVEPGGKTSLLFTGDGSPRAVSVKYEVEGSVQISEPARLG